MKAYLPAPALCIVVPCYNEEEALIESSARCIRFWGIWCKPGK